MTESALVDFCRDYHAWLWGGAGRNDFNFSRSRSLYHNYRGYLGRRVKLPDGSNGGMVVSSDLRADAFSHLINAIQRQYYPQHSMARYVLDTASYNSASILSIIQSNLVSK